MWKEKEATAALRAVIERQGLDPREYALHSDRIGGARRLAAMGLSIDVRHPAARTLEEPGSGNVY